MIPGAFTYHRPDSIAAAVKLRAELGDDAQIIAGGHSLVPMMKLRMAQPDHLIDLQALTDLRGIEVGADRISIGAMVTQHEIIGSKELAEACPILAEAARQIADPQVRYVGTIGGNVANGDPGNDMPGLMQCLDASYHLTGPGGNREVAARDFYEAAYFTALGDDEILTRVSFARPPAGAGYAYEKQKRKIGDYATAAAAVVIGTGFASVAMTNLGDTPIYCAQAGERLVAGDEDGAVAAVQAAIDPAEDNRGPVEFKRHIASVVLRRAIKRAADRRA